jgi:ribulose-phosphate 3-epimerase
MRSVVPSVLTSDPQDLERKIKILDRLADVIQIDIMDGGFVQNVSIGVEEVERVNLRAQLEIHLMVKHPVRYIQSFARIGAFRIIFHIESDDDAAEVIREIRQFGLQPGIALNPPTPVEEIRPFLDSVDVVLVMGVNPGLQGQKFMPEVLPKVRAIKKIRPEIIIEVDGGVNPETGPDLVDAGVDILNVGSYLFRQPPVESNWERMQQIINE